MISDDSAKRLHDRTTRGGALSQDELELLEAWISAQDQTEAKLLSPKSFEPSLADLRSQVGSASNEATSAIRRLFSENDLLREENVLLRRRLEEQMTRGATSPYRNAITSAIIQQLIVLVLASLILDGGDLLMFCSVAALAFWIGVAFIRMRRRQAPTKMDLILIRTSYLLLCIVTFFVVHLVWKLRGLI